MIMNIDSIDSQHITGLVLAGIWVLLASGVRTVTPEWAQPVEASTVRLNPASARARERRDNRDT